jgi:hypothetical protein
MSSSTIVDRPLDTAISDALTDLALDLRWSFNHSADQLWVNYAMKLTACNKGRSISAGTLRRKIRAIASVNGNVQIQARSK